MMTIKIERNRKEHVLVPPSDFPPGHLLTVSNRKSASEGEMFGRVPAGWIGAERQLLNKWHGCLPTPSVVRILLCNLGIIKFYMSYHGVDFPLNDWIRLLVGPLDLETSVFKGNYLHHYFGNFHPSILFLYLGFLLYISFTSWSDCLILL